MVTHFSLGSLFAFHGCSTSPFFTLLEWKYLAGADRTPEEESNDEAGLDCVGVAKGSVTLGTEEIESKKSFRLLSGIESVEVPDMTLPLKCAPLLLDPSIVKLNERQRTKCRYGSRRRVGK
jgi:hypothetical protein